MTTEQINASADFYVQLEDQITGADATNDGASTGNAVVPLSLMVGYYNSSLPTITDGNPGALQLDASGRAIVAQGGTWSVAQSGTWTVDLGTTDNAVLDAIAALLGTIDADTSTIASFSLNAGAADSTTQRVILASDDPLVEAVGGGVTLTGYRKTSVGNTPQQIKSGAGNLWEVCVPDQVDTNEVYLKIFDSASSPTVGTDVPIRTIRVPVFANSGAGLYLEFDTVIGFTNGCWIAATTGVASSDNTGPGTAIPVVEGRYS